MKVFKHISEMQAQARAWHQTGETIGFVPTMGYLHEGHLSLIRAATERASKRVVSIYVNPTQFGPNEDFDAYPRDFERDEALCRAEGTDAVFYPENSDMYAPDHSTWVTEESLGGTLCGLSRPSHFRGVTTVVTKLFNAVMPDVAVFGRKDGQQALVIQRMVRDLNIPVKVVVAPIIRETDGLAMSSRNRYLTSHERQAATAINRGLNKAEVLHAEGEQRSAVLVQVVNTEISVAGGKLDYIKTVARNNLQPVDLITEPSMLAVAAFFGNTRLIDNRFLR